MRNLTVCLLAAIACFGCKKSSPPQNGADELGMLKTNAVTAVNASIPKSTSKKIFMHWMPWFETPASRGAWGYHWKMNTQNPDVIVNGKRQIAAYAYPQTGPYASGDPDIIEYQLLLMKYSGVDGVMIDWPGTRVRYDYPDNLANSNALISKLNSLGLQFGIVEEDRNWDAGMAGSAHSDFTYMQSNYFNQSNYLKVNNVPVVLNFGPITFHQPSEWDTMLAGLNPRPKVIPLFGFTSQVGTNNAGGEFPWIYQDHPTVVNNYYAQAANFPISIGVVYPGFHSFYQAGGADGPTWQIPYNGTATFSTMLDKALASSVGIIQFATWNDYGEGTMIEPTAEFGYGFLTTMQQKLGVSYGQHELEQIYRLYQYRKQYQGNASVQQQLNQVFSYFAALQVSNAEALMNTISGGGTTTPPPVGTGINIKNKWLNTFLFEDNGQVKYGTSSTDARSKWALEQVSGHTRIKNVSTGHYLNIENLYSYAESTAVPGNFYSSYWVIEDYNGYKRIKSEWKGTYLNLENQSGFAQCTGVNNTFDSVQWTMN